MLKPQIPSRYRAVITHSIITLLLALCVVGSIAYYRLRYSESKRLRVVESGKLYRSGQLNARGLEQAIRRFGIRTVVNLQEEAPNPRLVGVREAELCQRLGVNYVFLYCDSLADEQYQEGVCPEAARIFLSIVNDPTNQPVLVHCRAGLHRTGVLCAFYRIHVQHWDPYAAWAELRANGYGEDRCSGRSFTFRDYLLPSLYLGARACQSSGWRCPVNHSDRSLSARPNPAGNSQLDPITVTVHDNP